MVYNCRLKCNGVARNVNYGWLLLFFSLFFFRLSPILFLFFLIPIPLLPLEVGPPKIQLEGLVERCQLRQRGLGRSAVEIKFVAL